MNDSEGNPECPGKRVSTKTNTQKKPAPKRGLFVPDCGTYLVAAVSAFGTEASVVMCTLISSLMFGT